MKDTREFILKTALSLFLQKSYRDVTMREIVEKTKLSKGAFYHHFASKEALFKEIANNFFLMGKIDYSSFSPDSLELFYHQYVDYVGKSIDEINTLVGTSVKGDPSLNFFLIMFEAINRFPLFLKMERDLHLLDLETWKKVIRHARKKGEISSSASDSQIAGLFLYCTDGVFIRMINSNHEYNFHDALLEAFDTIFNGLKS